MKRGDPHVADEIEIAPGVTVKDWKALTLRNKPEYEDHWQRAVDIVEKRLNDRYFEPCKLLIDSEPCESEDSRPPRYGFTIMAINCLLVETLQSFKMGKPSTENQSKELSKKFLRSTEGVSSEFDNSLAEAYYSDIRCGILHIGETQNLSLIRAVGPLVSEHKGGLVINRTMFFDLLHKDFLRYLGVLRSRNASPRRTDARKKMKDKMDFICRITPK